MSDPKTRAFELIDELVELYGVPNTPTEAALRLAITQIPTTSWQPMETAPAYPEAHEFLIWHASHGCAYMTAATRWTWSRAPTGPR